MKGRYSPARQMTPNQRKRASLAWQELLYTGAKGSEQIAKMRADAPVAPKPRAAADPDDSEGPVIKAVSQLLARHPLVLFAERRNSGALPYVNADGKAVPVRFHRVLTRQPVRVVDFTGWLKDGRPFALEAKRPSWKKPSDKREYEQAAFLMLIRNIGGVGAFVRGVDEALAAIDG